MTKTISRCLAFLACRLVAMLPVGDAAMAHHTNYAEPPDDILYANDWAANRTYVFDLK